jgi:anaerobic ribonucleoside-triphosphate reductase activating protein
MPVSPILRLHHLEQGSRANGPGVRTVLWTQGCSLGCPGCFNPQTHPGRGGKLWKVDDLIDFIISSPGHPEGLTISGGEPLQQLQPLNQLLRGIRQRSELSIILLTGFSWDEIPKLAGSHQLLSSVDVLFTGRYDRSHRLASGLRGSTNKTVHFLTNRYNPAALDTIPPAEVILARDGSLTISGIDPLTW